MNIDETFPRESEWINHADLQGKEVSLTITDVGVAEYEDGKRQPAVSFLGTDKKLGLNVINRETIKAAYGPETDNWIGKCIILFKSTTPFGNKIVDCVRLRCPAQQATGLPGAAPRHVGALGTPPVQAVPSVVPQNADGGHTPTVTPPFEPPKEPEKPFSEAIGDDIPF